MTRSEQKLNARWRRRERTTQQVNSAIAKDFREWQKTSEVIRRVMTEVIGAMFNKR